MLYADHEPEKHVLNYSITQLLNYLITQLLKSLII